MENGAMWVSAGLTKVWYYIIMSLMIWMMECSVCLLNLQTILGWKQLFTLEDKIRIQNDLDKL